MLLTPSTARTWARSKGITSEELRTEIYDSTYRCVISGDRFTSSRDGEDTDDGWVCNECLTVPSRERWPLAERVAAGVEAPARRAAA